MRWPRAGSTSSSSTPRRPATPCAFSSWWPRGASGCRCCCRSCSSTGGPAASARSVGGGEFRSGMDGDQMSAATYLYCLVHATKGPSLRAAPAGLPGTGKPRALAAGEGLWLVAADAPLDRYGAKPIEKGLQDLTWVSSCAVPHEAMVEDVSKAGTVL